MTSILIDPNQKPEFSDLACSSINTLHKNKELWKIQLGVLIVLIIFNFLFVLFYSNPAKAIETEYPDLYSDAGGGGGGGFWFCHFLPYICNPPPPETGQREIDPVQPTDNIHFPVEVAADSCLENNKAFCCEKDMRWPGTVCTFTKDSKGSITKTVEKGKYAEIKQAVLVPMAFRGLNIPDKVAKMLNFLGLASTPKACNAIIRYLNSVPESAQSSLEFARRLKAQDILTVIEKVTEEEFGVLMRNLNGITAESTQDIYIRKMIQVVREGQGPNPISFIGEIVP